MNHVYMYEGLKWSWILTDIFLLSFKGLQLTVVLNGMVLYNHTFKGETPLTSKGGGHRTTGVETSREIRRGNPAERV